MSSGPWTRPGARSRMLLQVHDELVFEIAPGERDEVEALVRREMAGAYPLKVPLDVSVGVGRPGTPPATDCRSPRQTGRRCPSRRRPARAATRGCSPRRARRSPRPTRVPTLNLRPSATIGPSDTARPSRCRIVTTSVLAATTGREHDEPAVAEPRHGVLGAAGRPQPVAGGGHARSPAPAGRAGAGSCPTPSTSTKNITR